MLQSSDNKLFLLFLMTKKLQKRKKKTKKKTLQQKFVHGTEISPTLARMHCFSSLCRLLSTPSNMCSCFVSNILQCCVFAMRKSAPVFDHSTRSKNNWVQLYFLNKLCALYLTVLSLFGLQKIQWKKIKVNKSPANVFSYIYIF